MDSIDWNSAGFEDFLARQEKLRETFQPTILFVHIENYPDGHEKERFLASNGFEANVNVGLSGVSIFIEDASEFSRLQDLANSHGLFLQMSIPRG